MARAPRVGIVVIGRNEGERLRKSLESMAASESRIVYVDSGSTDGSLEMSRSKGVEVVELDLSIPFTAARARNAGFDRLLELEPELERVQFVDGDCEMVAGWLELAERTLTERPELAAVCGRRRERHPEASIYNLVCDIEWDTPIGEAAEFGGDVMVRAEAFRKVGGYNPAMIAGEDPELALRLRKLGYKLARIDAEMTRHDAAISRFGQWWLRTLRSGHAYAEISAVHAGPMVKVQMRESASIWFWGLGVPTAALLLAWPTRGLSLLLLLGYAVLYYRTRRGSAGRGLSAHDAKWYAFFLCLSKFPSALGQLKYWSNRIRGKGSRLIEYKGPEAA